MITIAQRLRVIAESIEVAKGGHNFTAQSIEMREHADRLEQLTQPGADWIRHTASEIDGRHLENEGTGTPEQNQEAYDANEDAIQAWNRIEGIIRSNLPGELK